MEVGFFTILCVVGFAFFVWVWLDTRKGINNQIEEMEDEEEMVVEDEDESSQRKVIDGLEDDWEDDEKMPEIKEA
jgi:hypothetical protein